MDTSWLSRTQLLIGQEGLNKLVNAHVLVVGMGGVGSFVAEFIVRAGVGKITIVDGDVVEATNRNRQLPALTTTEGLHKVDVMRDRLLAINPELQVITVADFVTPEKMEAIVKAAPYDFVVDAIDSVTPKLTLIELAYHQKLPLVSSMGAGGKLDPTQIKIVDISKTYQCYLALNIRKRLKKIGIRKGFQAVFSPEPSLPESLILTDGSNYKKSAYGTISYLPAAFGGACASVVIRGILETNKSIQ